MKTLVIGYGNTLRGDDGVGPMVAQQVESWELPEVRSLIAHQLVPEMAEELAQADVVCFVDAFVQGSETERSQCRIERLFPHPTDSPLDHAWSPSVLLKLSKTLYGAEPVAYQLLISAVQFDYGETLSPVAISGIYWAIQTIKTLVGQKKVCYA